MHLLIPYASALADPAQETLNRLSLPHLSQLLAHLQATERDEADEYTLTPPHERVLAQLYGLSGPDGALPWAALWGARDGIDTAQGAWGMLSPTHWMVGTEQVSMLDPELLQLTGAESREILEIIRFLFETEGWILVYGAPTRWYVSHPSLNDLPTASLDRVIGRPVDVWMPSSKAGRFVRRLQNEVQMLLYTHPATEQRIASNRLPINTFWLSGCGALSNAKPTLPTDVILDERLRKGWLHHDWQQWAQAWQALDAGPVKNALQAAQQGQSVRITLCGERAAQTYGPMRSSIWKRWTAPWFAPSALPELSSL